MAAALPARRELSYPWVEYERRENVYVTTTNLSRLFRNEDISLGEEWRLRIGASGGSAGRETLVAAFSYDNTVGYGTHHLWRNGVSVNAQWDVQAHDWDNTLASLSSRYDYFIDDNSRWHARLGLDAGSGLPADKLLKGGGDTLLRGYPSGWQAGDRRVVLNVERRHFYRRHVLNLFRMGSAAFVDVGKAWDSSGQTVQSDRILADFGIGLRLNASKARPGRVMHLDIAVPLTDRGRVESFQWSLQAQDSF